MLSWGKTCCGGCESRQKPLSLVREFTQPRPKKGARKSAPRYCTVQSLSLSRASEPSIPLKPSRCPRHFDLPLFSL